MGRLYDKKGNLIPLCLRCTQYEEFPDCDRFRGQPEHWKKYAAYACPRFFFDNWWKINNMWCNKPSDFKTFRKPPVSGPQNKAKGSELFEQ